jgi:stage III sporulation protein AB
MIMKLTGGLIVMAASSLIGYILSTDFARRPQQLRALKWMLQMFENEISYMSNTLRVAFLRIAERNSGVVADIFRLTAAMLKESNGINASEAWERAVQNIAPKSAFKPEDIEIIKDFGKILGSSDLEGQIKNIRLTINQLSIQESKAEEMRKKNEGLYRKLGLLAGAAIVIILL